MTRKDFANKHKSELDIHVTMGMLLEYTDDFLIPSISDIVDEKLSQQKTEMVYELKSYISDKLAEYTSDIFKRLEKREQRDRDFKKKLLALLREHDIGKPEELAYLEGLVQGT